MKNKLPPDDIRFVTNALRQASVKWPGRTAALNLARKKVFVRMSKADTPIYKFHWRCAKCLKWFRDVSQVEVDHINEIGSFCGDWNNFLARFFPDVDQLQVLCQICHLKKTNAFNAAHLKWKRKK